MDQSGLHEAKAWCVVPALTEIGILVNSARDETCYLVDCFRVGPENEGK